MVDIKADRFRASKFHAEARLQQTLMASALGLMLAGTGLLLAPVGVLAHAIVVAARPAMNATVVPGVLDIRLDFNSRIDHKRSAITLARPDGAKALVGITANGPASVLSGQVQVTMPGPWKLYWQVLSVDGHITRGELAFVVRDGQQAR